MKTVMRYYQGLITPFFNWDHGAALLYETKCLARKETTTNTQKIIENETTCKDCEQWTWLYWHQYSTFGVPTIDHLTLVRTKQHRIIKD